MKNTIYYRGLRYIYRLLKRGYYALPRKAVQQPERLLFTFGGRAEGWPGMALSFYKNLPDFAASIQYCNKILVENGGAEILSYFEGPVNEHYFDDESKFTCITAIQIAIIKHHNDRGIYPNAVMGVSMGEPAAAYAAGALTAEEALKICLGYMQIHTEQSKQYVFIFLNVSHDEAQLFCKQAPVWVEIIYEDNPGAVLITCHKEDVAQLEIAINEKGYSFALRSEQLFIPYHTSLIKSQYDLLKKIYKDFELRPLKCDYYSPTLGIRIPKHTVLSPDYWYTLAHTPVLFSRSLQAVLDNGYKTFLQIGPAVFSERQLSNAVANYNVQPLNVFQDGVDELENYKGINIKLQQKLFEYTLTAEKDAGVIFNDFKSGFDMYKTTTQPGYDYLRKAGPIHFLPMHNSWIVLNYEDVDSVLKQPQIYSSSIFKDVDPILIGADPELHKVIRALLQPMFSPAVIAELSSFTAITADDILNKLCKQDSFDFVKDYANPLSLFVLCNFFGLSAEDADKMMLFTGIDYKDITYWQRLEQYFNDQFNVCQLTKQDSLWGELRKLVQEEQFVFADAVSLLKIIWTAGIATTSGLISASIYTLLNEPQLADQIGDDEKLAAKFIEECLRLQTPVTAINRITAQPVELAGQHLDAGVLISLHLKSAMTDPAHFNSPHELSVTRPAKRHLAFGTGIHQCIGMGIARAEANASLNIVLKKIPMLREYNFAEPQYLTFSEIQPMTSLVLVRKSA